MPSRRCPRTFVAAILVGSVALAGCTSGERDDEASGEPESTEAPVFSVTIPPQRLTPFCQGMIDLADRLLNDPPADPAAEIISVYESLVDVVPAEIENEFLTVLARLQSGDTGDHVAADHPQRPRSGSERHRRRPPCSPTRDTTPTRTRPSA